MGARLTFAIVLAACGAPPSMDVLRNDVCTPQATDVDERLASLAVSDVDFYRPVLYTWTTASSIAELRASHVLLVATAASGGFVSPYHRAVARLADAGDDIARSLRDDPELARCRYAWPAPFATVRGLGPRGYGNALIRIELRPDAWIGRFEPEAADPFVFVDATGARVDPADVVAQPDRIGAIFHVQVHPTSGVSFREYVVCSAGMIASWSIATPQIRTELDAEIDLANALRAQTWSRAELAAPAAPAWSGNVAASTLERWHAALAFDNARYRPEASRLAELVDALADYEPAGDALTVVPSP